jgi:hypothetical protein
MAHPSVAPLVEQFRVSTNLYVKALGGFDRAALLTRPGERSNPMLWIAGHLAQARARVLAAIGAPREVPWGGLFATGSHIVEPDRYPSVDEIRATWLTLSAELEDRLGALTEDDLADLPPMRIPSVDGTLRGSIALFAFHEGYHIGQMGYVRKWLGGSPLVD